MRRFKELSTLGALYGSEVMEAVMRLENTRFARWLMIVAIAISGCATQDPNVAFHDDLRYFDDLVTETEYADAEVAPQTIHDAGAPPPALRHDEDPEYWPMTVNEAIRTALANSQVLNDLGGTLVRSPESVRTLQDASIEETDPRFGVAAALSAFDAEYAMTANFDNNDRILNNRFVAGTNVLREDLHDYVQTLRKRAATGSEFTLRHTMDYAHNNANGNIFPSAWDTAVEAEIRHPLMQGNGVVFNRIAGPDGAPGAISGVVIARLNTDISLADLELGLRNLVSNVENAYWDLYFAYRDLDAKKRARDESLAIWRELAASIGRRGAEKDKVAQAREQYHRFEVDVQNALSGRLVEGTRAGGDSSGGSFRATGGVYVAERRLRLLLGLPLSDDRLLRPAEDPSMAEAVFEWDSVVGEAVSRRAELRRQRLSVRRRELELVANRNFLRPRLDAVALYRFRGFGDELLNPTAAHHADNPEIWNSAFASLASLEQQEWQLGFEFSLPIGFRQAHAAIRNGQLALARERAILEEQERQIIHDLGNAVTELKRAYTVAQVNLDRHNAAKERLQTLLARKDDEFNAGFMLDAQQRLASAESDFFRSLVEYALAVKNVHIEKGTWKSYHNVLLAEELTGNDTGDGAVVPHTPADEAPTVSAPSDATTPGGPEPSPAAASAPTPTAALPARPPAERVRPAAPVHPAEPMEMQAGRRVEVDAGRGQTQRIEMRAVRRSEFHRQTPDAPARSGQLPPPAYTQSQFQGQSHPNDRPPAQPERPAYGPPQVAPPHATQHGELPPGFFDSAVESTLSGRGQLPPGHFDSAVESSISGHRELPPGFFDSAVESSLSGRGQLPPGHFDSAVESSISGRRELPASFFDSAVESTLSSQRQFQPRAPRNQGQPPQARQHGELPSGFFDSAVEASLSN